MHETDVKSTEEEIVEPMGSATPSYPIPPDEESRLEALHGLAILDTLPEDEYDRITRLARIVFGSKMAAISLVDEKRQWFKSAPGIGAESTPREYAFCAYTILTDQPTVVLDATEDARFKNNPLVTGEPGIRFYAGAPLMTASGARVGSLCVIDREPRTSWTAVDTGVLKDLARLVSNELQARQARKEHHQTMQELRSVRGPSALDGAIDALTGLPDRRALATVISQSKAAADRADRFVGLVYVGLHGVDRINEEKGEQTGDFLLKTMGTRLRGSVRTNDYVLRVAGDQFLVVLQGLETVDNVDRPIQKLMAAAALPVRLEDGTDILLSVSAGVSYYPHCGSTPLELVNEARTAMLRAKDAGENMYAINLRGKPIVVYPGTK